MTNGDITLSQGPKSKQRSLWQDAWRRFKKRLMTCSPDRGVC